MKKIALGFLLALGLFILFAFAQDLESVFMNRTFVEVVASDKLNEVDTVTASDTGLFTIKLEISDGSVCYALSSKESAGALESIDQIVGLGCVK
jgi:hypothetical protein